MRIALIDVDSHNFPNLPLMKISAYQKAHGHTVDWWNGFEQYDTIFMSKVFTDEYSPDIPKPYNGHVVQGGTGYGLGNSLPYDYEHIYPDYSLYPRLTKDTAFGFLTRGCPRNCQFCIVSSKEGRASRHVADLNEFWRGQRNIKLLDPNLLAAPNHEELLQQLADSGAYVDYTQGLDIRLTTKDNMLLLNKVKTKALHFAWDNPKEDLTEHFKRVLHHTAIKDPRRRIVYVLTNFDSSHEGDLWRVYTLRDMGFTPFIMIYNKSTAPRQTRLLQRWCNNRIIFRSEPDFSKYNPKIG